MNQSEFNEVVSQQIEKLTKENAALKKQLAAINPELLADMKITIDSAQSLHNVMMTEKAQIAEQSLQSRKEFKENQEQVFARQRNNQNLNTQQLAMMYDRAAEVQSNLDEIRQLKEEINAMNGNLVQRQETVINNIDSRMNELDTREGRKYIRELFAQEERAKDNQALTEIAQRELRNLLNNPSGYANPETAANNE